VPCRALRHGGPVVPVPARHGAAPRLRRTVAPPLRHATPQLRRVVEPGRGSALRRHCSLRLTPPPPMRSLPRAAAPPSLLHEGWESDYRSLEHLHLVLLHEREIERAMGGKETDGRRGEEAMH